MGGAARRPAARGVAARLVPAAPALLLAGALLLVYGGALRAPFQFDDYNVIVLNPAVHTIRAWWESMPGIRPLLKLSYALSWSSGLGPAGFRALNLLCHAASSLMVFLLCRRWGEGLGVVRERVGAVALTAALLFALHPAQTEAVTYVSGRSVSLMALGYLGALLTFSPGATGWRRLLSPLLFAAALFIKETAWPLPFALLLAEAAGRRGRWRERLTALTWHWIALALAAVGMLAVPAYRRLLAGSVAAREPGANLLTQIGGQFYLLTRPLLSLGLNIDPDLPVHAAPTVALALEASALLSLALTGFLQLRRRPWLGLGILWLFLHLLPTNSLLPRHDVANDRQLYLALVGPMLALAAALWVRLPPRSAVLAAALLALGLGGATALRNLDYRTEVSLWRATVRESPAKARAWNNLGYAHQLAGEREAARAAYRRALVLDPDHIKARLNLEFLGPPAGP
jgi:tetratricopeptide (TPR) repeat protein